MATVYIVQEPRGRPIDSLAESNLENFGKSKFVLGPFDFPNKTPIPCLQKLTAALDNFNDKEDYVCYAGGDPLALALALVVLYEGGHDEIRMLSWDRNRSRYLPIVVPLTLMPSIQDVDL